MHICSSDIPQCVCSAVKGVVVLYAQLSQRCEEAEALAEARRIEKEAVAARLAATEERLQSAIASGKDTENAALAENERRAVALHEVGYQGVPSSFLRYAALLQPKPITQREQGSLDILRIQANCKGRAGGPGPGRL